MKEEIIGIVGRQVHKAVRDGVLNKPDSCSKCHQVIEDKSKLHAHHFNYKKPLDVMWVCTKCHRKIHAYLNWLRHRVDWLEYCARTGTDPEDGLLPSINPKTGIPTKKSIFQRWRSKTENSRRLVDHQRLLAALDA